MKNSNWRGLCLILLLLSAEAITHQQKASRTLEPETIVNVLTQVVNLAQAGAHAFEAVKHKIGGDHELEKSHSQKTHDLLASVIESQNLVQLAASSTPYHESAPVKAFVVVVMLGILMISLHTGLADPTGGIKNLFGFKSQDILSNILRFLFSFGLGVVLLIIGLTYLFSRYAVMSEFVIPNALPSNARLAELKMIEWYWEKPSLPAGAPTCLGRHRGEAMNYAVCGFCTTGHTSVEHNYGTSTCTDLPNQTPFSCDHTAINRLPHDVITCGSCLANYYGKSGPATTPCKQCTVCATGYVDGCKGDSPGSCIDSCLGGYFTTSNPNTCNECPVGKWSLAGASSCSDYTACVAGKHTGECTRTSDCDSCAQFRLPHMGQMVYAVPLREAVSPDSHYIDHFAIRTASGTRFQPFNPSRFEYEWYPESSKNPETYPRIWFPWTLDAPIQIRGKVETPWVDARSKLHVKIEIPRGNEIIYPLNNTWLISPHGIFNRALGAFNLTKGDVVPWQYGNEYKSWNSTLIGEPHLSQVMGSIGAGLMTRISPVGEWRLTTQMKLPQDPTSVGCPPLPIRITVIAADGVGKRTYSIFPIGSDRKSCAASPQYTQVQRLLALKASKRRG